VRGIAEFSLLLLLASACLAQAMVGGVSHIRKVRIVRLGREMHLEFVLTNAVIPKVTIEKSPDRLVLDLPNVNGPFAQPIAVNRNGVIDVRLAADGTGPLVTRAIVALDGEHPYKLATARNVVILTVLPVVTAGHGAAPATNRTLWVKILPSRGANSKPGRSMSAAPPAASDASLHVSFEVKYVAEGAAYLADGRNVGLAEGMKLTVRNPAGSGDSSAAPGQAVAELQIVSVAETSAVAEVHDAKRDVKPGDWAELSPEDVAKLGKEPEAGTTGTRPTQAVAAAESGAFARVAQPSPEAGRIRARIGFGYSGITSSGSTPGHSGSLGLAFSTDTTQIAGTHWNLEGYWRGRLTTNSQPEEQTLQDYLDRTYLIQLYYDNPDSEWVMGFGRLYLPWAVSLDTIDGGYVGRKVAQGVTAGVFFGSTPDPTSWTYQPDQQIGGSFVNFEGGSFDQIHYTSTAGFALSMLKWQLDRPYLFLENGFSYRNLLSIYHSLIVDSPQGVSTDGITPGAGVSRSYLTVDLQPKAWISFGIVHNYFRDVPTAATALIGTGMVDKLLYQGLNGSVRVKPVRKISVYTTLGQGDKTGDTHRSLNQMFGAAWEEIWRTGIRADIHYSKFDSDFARGNYKVLSLSRHLGNRMMWDAQVGRQNLNSPFTVNQRSMFVNTSFDTNFGKHTFLQSGYTLEQGSALNYRQWYLSLGYRFDEKGPGR
jgi:AMIN domain